MNEKPNAISLAGLALIAIMVLHLINERRPETNSAVQAQTGSVALSGAPEAGQSNEPAQQTIEDHARIRAPYDEYILTQGPHGASYGHMAIDLTAGKGADILSPIQGEVTGLYVDEYGNTTLELENKVYKITLLHGDYDVTVGQAVGFGQRIGSESNHGYTVDWQGQPCNGRDCGYHSHLNIFDKRLDSNVNPLEILPPQS